MEISSILTMDLEGKVTFSTVPIEIKERYGIIEFQAFRRNNNNYIVKELVILDLLTFMVYPFLFKPPCSFNKLNAKTRKTNKWLTQNFHHIDWNDGYTNLRDLQNIMYHFCSKFTRLYTRGLEKRNWIQQYSTTPVFDVKIDKTFKYEMNDVCILTKSEKHSHYQCAMVNAYRLASFLQPTALLCGGGSGGGIEGYKYGECEGTLHEYYSSHGQENTS